MILSDYHLKECLRIASDFTENEIKMKHISNTLQETTNAHKAIVNERVDLVFAIETLLDKHSLSPEDDQQLISCIEQLQNLPTVKRETIEDLKEFLACCKMKEKEIFAYTRILLTSIGISEQ